jgi:serine/threonine protein phosphatase PrpC
LILACDGLWKVFSSQSALDFVLEKFKASSCNLDDEYLTWVKIIDDLAAAAVLKGSGDNVSIVFVVFGDNIRKIF